MFKRTLMAASLAVAALASAQSMAAVNGGGGTLAAPFYNTSGVLPAGFAAYIGVGSGAGKLAFLNNDPSQFGLPAGTNVHWAGSDSKLASTDITTYNTNHGAAWGPLIQVPAMATAVTIPFNKAGGNLNLTTQELCGVFSGRYDDWSGIAGNGGRTGPLTVAYRSDSSGTTELFTRFLNAKCSEAGIFNVTTSFGSSYTAYPNGTIPTNFVSAVGSPAVMTALNAADSRITYMSPDLAVTSTADLDNATKVATVNSIAPNLTNVGTAVSGVTAPARPTAPIQPLGTGLCSDDQP